MAKEIATFGREVLKVPEDKIRQDILRRVLKADITGKNDGVVVKEVITGLNITDNYFRDLARVYVGIRGNASRHKEIAKLSENKQREQIPDLQLENALHKKETLIFLDMIKDRYKKEDRPEEFGKFWEDFRTLHDNVNFVRYKSNLQTIFSVKSYFEEEMGINVKYPKPKNMVNAGTDILIGNDNGEIPCRIISTNITYKYRESAVERREKDIEDKIRFLKGNDGQEEGNMVTVISRSKSNDEPFKKTESDYAKKILKNTEIFRRKALKYYPGKFSLIIILPAGAVINDETGKKENLQSDDGKMSPRLKKLFTEQFLSKLKNIQQSGK